MRSKFFSCLSSMSNPSVAPVESLTAENQAEMDKRKPINVNQYATKKTVAQGMLDIALLTSNACQLKYIIQSPERLPSYTLLLWLISASILLQICVGALFMIIGRMNINDKPDHRFASKLNDVILLLVFLITVINVIISVFGFSADSPTKQPSSATF